MTFTPGPWIASKFGFQVLTGDNWSTICELKGPAEWEDGRGVVKQEYEWQNQEANACLIAAAPDLLAVLKRYVAAYPAFRIKPIGAPGSEKRIEQENLMALEDAARAVLAAATVSKDEEAAT